MDRRKFFKVTAATGAGATLAGCGNPENQLIRFIPDEAPSPGLSEWKPGICPLCDAGCGTTVRVMGGDAEVVRDGQAGIVRKGLAKKLEGNPLHPVSRGRLCVRGQAAIQVTYHPDRITQPLRRVGDRGSGEYEPVGWDAALAEVLEELDTLRAAGNASRLAFLTRPLSGQRGRLVGDFLRHFGAPEPVVFEVFGDEVLRRANEESFGFRQLPTLDLGGARYLVSFGADILGTWNSPVAQSAAYGDMRQGRPGIRAKFVQVEARMSQTGANADEWVPVRPGTEGALALGMAHVIMTTGLRGPGDAGRSGRLIEGWSGGLAAFTPEETSIRTGIGADRVRRLAREFAENGPALAVAAGPALAHTNGFATALAVNALNALVGSVGQRGGILFTPAPPSAPPPLRGARFEDLVGNLLAGEAPPVEALLLNEANPVFGAPPAWRVGEALRGVRFIASFGHFLDETSILADIILPDHSFLESWTDHVPESGTTWAVASVAPPAMAPLHATRSMPDVLLEIGRSLAAPLAPPLRWTTYEELLGEVFRDLPPDGGGWDVWGRSREQGGWWREEPPGAPLRTDSSRPAVAWSEPQFDGDEGTFPFHFQPYASQAFLDGSLAHLPWLQELPDPLSTAMWSTWVEVNPQTARELGIADGDLVEVASAHGSIEAPALIFPGIAPDVIAMPVGQGHRAYTRYASGRGSNPLEVLAPSTVDEAGTLAWAATRVRLGRRDGAANLILFAGSLREHETHDR
jgi:anaerobic selenocysteine-containing dehydrogenase